ncbi:MAG: hypothetical protein AAFX06_10185 [Planctomycetota bacterium]
MKMVETAANRGYPITDDIREAMVSRLFKIIADTDAKSRTHIAAVRALASLDKQSEPAQPTTTVNLNLGVSEKKKRLRERALELLGE